MRLCKNDAGLSGGSLGDVVLFREFPCPMESAFPEPVRKRRSVFCGEALHWLSDDWKIGDGFVQWSLRRGRRVARFGDAFAARCIGGFDLDAVPKSQRSKEERSESSVSSYDSPVRPSQMSDGSGAASFGAVPGSEVSAGSVVRLSLMSEKSGETSSGTALEPASPISVRPSQI